MSGDLPLLRGIVFAAMLLPAMAACNADRSEADANRGASGRDPSVELSESSRGSAAVDSGSRLDAVQGDPWARADSLVVRLSPDAFSDVLPAPVIVALHERECTIPQATAYHSQPHNVIRGAFTRSGREDWAVLCSRRGRSVILVFRAGSPADVSELAASEDRVWLQGGAGDAIDFSRSIAAVDAAYIRRQHERHPDSTVPPEPLDHEGIEDIFIGKASVIHYFHDGRWLMLQGAD